MHSRELIAVTYISFSVFMCHGVKVFKLENLQAFDLLKCWFSLDYLSSICQSSILSLPISILKVGHRTLGHDELGSNYLVVIISRSNWASSTVSCMAQIIRYVPFPIKEHLLLQIIFFWLLLIQFIIWIFEINIE